MDGSLKTAFFLHTSSTTYFTPSPASFTPTHLFTNHSLTVSFLYLMGGIWTAILFVAQALRSI